MGSLAVRLGGDLGSLPEHPPICAFLQSSRVRRVALAIFAALACLGALTGLYGPSSWVATWLTPAQILHGSALVTLISLIAATIFLGLCLKPSLHCPEFREKCLQKVVDGGSFPEGFKVSKSEINQMVFRGVFKASADGDTYEKIMEPLGSQILSVLHEQNLELLKVPFMEHLIFKVVQGLQSVEEVLNHPGNKTFKIEKKEIEAEVIQERVNQIMKELNSKLSEGESDLESIRIYVRSVLERKLDFTGLAAESIEQMFGEEDGQKIRELLEERILENFDLSGPS